MDRISEKQAERDAEQGNLAVFTAKLARQLMQQDPSLLMVEAARKARELYGRGIRDLWE